MNNIPNFTEYSVGTEFSVISIEFNNLACNNGSFSLFYNCTIPKFPRSIMKILSSFRENPSKNLEPTLKSESMYFFSIHCLINLTRNYYMYQIRL